MKPVRNATLMDNPAGLLMVWKAEEQAYPGSSVKLQDVIAELSRWGRFRAAFQALF